MGTFLDTTVFIELERAVRKLPADVASGQVARRLEDQLGPEEDVAIAAITATAIAAGWRVGTANTRHFERVPGLEVVAINMAN